jgi:hypothetical protein
MDLKSLHLKTNEELNMYSKCPFVLLKLITDCKAEYETFKRLKDTYSNIPPELIDNVQLFIQQELTKAALPPAQGLLPVQRRGL